MNNKQTTGFAIVHRSVTIGWRNFGGFYLDSFEMISYWHPIMWKPAS